MCSATSGYTSSQRRLTQPCGGTHSVLCFFPFAQRVGMRGLVSLPKSSLALASSEGEPGSPLEIEEPHAVTSPSSRQPMSVRIAGRLPSSAAFSARQGGGARSAGPIRTRTPPARQRGRVFGRCLKNTAIAGNMRSSAVILTLSLAGACNRTPEVKPEASPTETTKPVVSALPAPAPPVATRSFKVPGSERVVAIGDVHGDLRALRAALRLAGAIDSD